MMVETLKVTVQSSDPFLEGGQDRIVDGRRESSGYLQFSSRGARLVMVPLIL